MTERTPFGVISINKPLGETSADVVNRVSWLLRRRLGVKRIKVGHCGTLDPLATGVLVICVGSATRLMLLIQEQTKRYRGRFLLGTTTDTDDLEGRIVQQLPVENVEGLRSRLEELLPEFTGTIQQVPPRFSAVHINGQRAYDLARDGKEFEIAAKEVVVSRLELTAYEPPSFELDIECGTGTYIRSIGRDLGTRLGCGATMTSLERTSVGPFVVGDALPLNELAIENVLEALKSPLVALPGLPRYQLSEVEVARVRTGNFVSPAEPFAADTGDVCLLTESGELAAVARWDSKHEVLRPAMLLIEARH